MQRLLSIPLILLLCILTGTPASAQPRTQSADLHSFVNWDFRHRKKLRGWRATETVILKTLEQSHAGRAAHTLVENGSPSSLRDFLRSLPTRAECGFSIVYLASHQSPDGEWDFMQRKLESLGTLAAEANIPPHPNRIVIVDACYAAALLDDSAWRRGMQSPVLFAALASEETQELDFSTPQPLDLRKRYPAAAAWLDRNLGRKWDGRLSFLGFVWVQTLVSSPAMPAGADGWLRFMKRCEQTASTFRREADERLASRVTLANGASRGQPSPSSRRKN